MNDKPQKGSEKYKRILAAAIKVFARNGFYGSKVSQIAKEAKVADGTIYLYFKNKDDILISLFEDKMDEIISRLRIELAKISDVEEKLRLFVRLHLSLADLDPDLADVISVELRQSTQFMKEYNNTKFQEFLRILSDIIREGKDKGVFRKDISPGVIKRGLFGMMDELSLFYVLGDSGKQRKYSLNQIADEVSDFVIRGLRV